MQFLEVVEIFGVVGDVFIILILILLTEKKIWKTLLVKYLSPSVLGIVDPIPIYFHVWPAC